MDIPIKLPPPLAGVRCPHGVNVVESVQVVVWTGLKDWSFGVHVNNIIFVRLAVCFSASALLSSRIKNGRQPHLRFTNIIRRIKSWLIFLFFSSAHYNYKYTFSVFSFLLQSDSPNSSMRSEWCTMRSRTASALVFSPVTSFHSLTGICEVMFVDRF